MLSKYQSCWANVTKYIAAVFSGQQEESQEETLLGIEISYEKSDDFLLLLNIGQNDCSGEAHDSV